MSETAENRADAPRPGATLERAREARGLTQTQAAQEMRVDLTTLRALESDDYARLGAPIFVKGHLRNYAKFLGLDAGPLIEAYERIATPKPPSLVGYRNEGEQMGGHIELRRLLPVVVGGVALVLLALFAAWLFRRPDAPPPAPAPAPASAPASVAAPAPATEPAATAPTVAAPATVPKAEPAAEPAKPVASNGEVRLVLRFSGESWVEVTNAKGEMLVYEQFGAGRSREVSAMPPLRVFLGQASAVALTVDGKAVDLAPLTKRDATARVTIGPNGAIR